MEGSLKGVPKRTGVVAQGCSPSPTREPSIIYLIKEYTANHKLQYFIDKEYTVCFKSYQGCLCTLRLQRYTPYLSHMGLPGPMSGGGGGVQKQANDRLMEIKPLMVTAPCWPNYTWRLLLFGCDLFWYQG